MTWGSSWQFTALTDRFGSGLDGREFEMLALDDPGRARHGLRRRQDLFRDEPLDHGVTHRECLGSVAERQPIITLAMVGKPVIVA